MAALGVHSAPYFNAAYHAYFFVDLLHVLMCDRGQLNMLQHAARLWHLPLHVPALPVSKGARPIARWLWHRYSKPVATVRD
jgi:hypothetical protein